MFSRTDSSVLGQWWWTVDRWSLGAIILLMLIGSILMMAATPLMADRLKLPSLYFVQRHAVLLFPAIFVLIGASVLSAQNIRRVALGGFVCAYILLLLTPFIGIEIKGARRWINIFGISLQASEFIKPTMAVLTAWLLTARPQIPTIKWVILGVYVLVIIPLAMQPDFGMIVVISLVSFGQIFLAGLPLIYVFSFALIGMGGLVGAYFLFPHVASRIDRFMDPSSGDCYQVQQAKEAFSSGGLFGQGPGEGIVKRHLPDAHADFIFAVIGEEFGLFACILIIGLFAFILTRGYFRVFKEMDLFRIFAVGGLLAQFTIQALINIASTLHLIPTKGMTLPFLSYGGSSCVSLALGMGMVLGLTRRQIRQQTG